jgi:hypothetical protein
MFILGAVNTLKTPFNFKKIRRLPYPSFKLKTPLKAPARLTRGLARSGGRGLAGLQTVFSKGSWAVKTRFHLRADSVGGLYGLHFVAGFSPRPRNLSHSVILRSFLGGYVLGLANHHHVLFSYCQVAPDSLVTAGVLWAQKSWWWRLALLMPHTNVTRVPLYGGAGFYAVSGGSAALFVSGGLWGSWAFLLLPSGQPKFVLSDSYVSLGITHPFYRDRRPVILAGDARRLGCRPRVRGTVKNPNDHPNGGRTRSLLLSLTPWAKPAKKPRGPRLVPKLKALAKRRVEALKQPMVVVDS